MYEYSADYLNYTESHYLFPKAPTLHNLFDLVPPAQEGDPCPLRGRKSGGAAPEGDYAELGREDGATPTGPIAFHEGPPAPQRGAGASAATSGG
jgi:hypothetical protein